MTPRRTFRPALEALELRQLMAADGLAECQAFMGPAPLASATNLQVAGEDTSITSVYTDRSGLGYVNPYVGDLEVTVVDGVLRILGQWGDNNIRIFGGAGTYWIQAYYTKINGELWMDERQFTYTGVTNGIEIDLGLGDDNIALEISNAPAITIRTGGGNDRVALRGPDNSSYRSPDYGPGGAIGMALIPVPVEAIPLAITGDVFIDTGAGDDRISGYAKATGDVTIRMGDGDDSFVEGPLEREFWRPVTSRSIAGDGVRSVDLGAGQDVDIIPDNITADPNMGYKFSAVPYYFSTYRGMVERGENTPGVPQIVRPFSWEIGRVDGEGRLEVEIQFTQGFARVIDRLIARGITIDAYTVLGGGARAVIREEDLVKFANLPELIRIQAVNYNQNPRPISQRWEYDWDYVRPGSAVAEEEARWGPRPPVAPTPPPVYPPPAEPVFPIVTIDPPDVVLPIRIGPHRLEDIRTSSAVSLLESYYGVKFIGPLAPPITATPSPDYAVLMLLDSFNSDQNSYESENQ